MKKIALILSVLSILTLTGCDFLRKVAGRPTSGELAAKAELIASKKGGDTVKPSADLQALERERQIKREKQAEEDLVRLGVRKSDVFRFGTPVSPMEFRYYLIIGVFRTESTALAQCERGSRAGFSPFAILFPNGARAVCLCASDSLSEIVDVISRCDTSLCPSDAWVYVKGE